jgi:hypothetical protein
MNQFWFEPGGRVNFGKKYDSNPLRRRYKFPIEVESGVIVEVNGERHMALAKTKATPIELSHCRACSLFRKPICELLKCENVRFERLT